MNDPSAAIKPFPSLLARGKRWDHLELLERIDASGSISTAAGAMGMSYKAAWLAVESMNNLSEHPVVERQSGGKLVVATITNENIHELGLQGRQARLRPDQGPTRHPRHCPLKENHHV